MIHFTRLPYNALRDLAPIVRVANTPFMQRFEALGCEPAGGTPEAFAAYFRADIEKWAKVIRDAGVRLE